MGKLSIVVFIEKTPWVKDSFKIAFRDEDNILDKLSEKKIRFNFHVL